MPTRSFTAALLLGVALTLPAIAADSVAGSKAAAAPSVNRDAPFTPPGKAVPRPTRRSTPRA